jgi:hypothetical protein
MNVYIPSWCRGSRNPRTSPLAESNFLAAATTSGGGTLAKRRRDTVASYCRVLVRRSTMMGELMRRTTRWKERRQRWVMQAWRQPLASCRAPWWRWHERISPRLGPSWRIAYAPCCLGWGNMGPSISNSVLRELEGAHLTRLCAPIRLGPVVGGAWLFSSSSGGWRGGWSLDLNKGG